MADDVVDWVSPVAAKARRAPGVATRRPSAKRGLPKGSGLAVRNTRPGRLGFAYDDGLEVLGFGPGLTVLTGLAPPTPSNNAS
jgi:hypothetical protein